MLKHIVWFAILYARCCFPKEKFVTNFYSLGIPYSSKYSLQK